MGIGSFRDNDNRVLRFPIPVRRSPQSEDTAKQFLHRCVSALESALKYSNLVFGGSDTIVIADFGKLAPGFKPDDTSFARLSQN